MSILVPREISASKPETKSYRLRMQTALCVLNTKLSMPPPSKNPVFSYRSSVRCPLTHISRDAITARHSGHLPPWLGLGFMVRVKVGLGLEFRIRV